MPISLLMKTNDINVLIVDDDPSIRKSISEAVERAGFKPLVASKPAEARSISKVQQIHVAIIDCMLPGQNGVDLAVEIREVITHNDVIFFITGIYKDKMFASEALNRAKAECFFYKPFDIEELIIAIKAKVKSPVKGPKLTTHSLLSKLKFSTEELKEVINSMDEVSGFDISYLLSTLMFLRSTGKLQIVDVQKQKHVIDLVNGKIRRIQGESAFQTMGQLLVKQGLLTQNEYEEISEKSNKSDFEDSLVEENWVSPHAMSILRKEQVSSELEKIITPGAVEVLFVSTKEDNPSACDIDYESIKESLHEIIEFQMNGEWLDRFYSSFMNCAVVLVPEVGKQHPIFNYPATKKIEDLFEVFSKSPMLGEILNKDFQMPKDVFYKALHILTINRLVVFVGASQAKEENVGTLTSMEVTNINRRFLRLNILLDDIKDLNAIEIFQSLGASENANTKEVEKIFKTFSHANSLDRLPKDASDELKDLNRKVFSIVSEAYEIMIDDTKRENYSYSVKQKKAELHLKAQNLVERGIINLRQGRYDKSIEELETAYQYNPNQQTLLYLYWVEIKMNKENLTLERIKEINDSLITLPMEDKRNETYHLVYGLLKREEGSFKASGDAFRKSLQINPSFLDAKRELMSLIKESKKRNQSIFTGDLSTVVSGFFKKKG